MPEFDANEDPMRLSGSSKDEPFELPKLRPRFTPRARQLASSSCLRLHAHGAGRTAAKPLADPRRPARRRCFSARAVGLRAAKARQHKRLWMACNGRIPGSPS